MSVAFDLDLEDPGKNTKKTMKKVIDHGRGFWRVQVKCSTWRVGSHYRLELSRKGVCYPRARPIS